MRRRDFIIGIAGTAVGLPLPAHAQQPERMRRVGVIVSGSETDPESIARLAAFQKALRGLGWADGKNVQLVYRFGTDDDEFRRQAKELVALEPDVIFAATPPVVMGLLRVTRSVPIVFAAVTDPVGLGIVQSLSRPGGNATGFLSAEFSFGAKWLELLNEIAPRVRRVGVLTDPAGQLRNSPPSRQQLRRRALKPSCWVFMMLPTSSASSATSHVLPMAALSYSGLHRQSPIAS
jgi:putative ABC transport system substrate-binding protein